LGDPDLAPFNAGNDLFGDGSLLVLPTPGHTPGRSPCWYADPDTHLWSAT
jgi:N-acyl homoserine lactone hydrolase